MTARALTRRSSVETNAANAAPSRAAAAIAATTARAPPSSWPSADACNASPSSVAIAAPAAPAHTVAASMISPQYRTPRVGVRARPNVRRRSRRDGRVTKTRSRPHRAIVSVVRCSPAIVAAVIFVLAGSARAAVTEPDARDEDQFDFMNLLSHHALHDIEQERWNAYGQFTYISSWKRPFRAAYTNLNGSTKSLLPTAERSFTGTFTAYLGLALWRGGEVYAVPEVIAERPLSGLAGLGGAIQNFELQKQGSATPLLYLSRAYFRQTLDLGGEHLRDASQPMQLGKTTDSRRLVLTVGNFSILDFFDKNAFAGDLRRQFFNMSFLTYAAYDFAADARGYAWGGVAELFWDNWAFRIARITPPKNPNELPIDFRLYKYFGDQLEIEHRHEFRGRVGAVRVLAYRNRERMARFDDAVAAFETDPNRNATTCTTFNYGSQNATAPDLCWARRPNIKSGVGINLEQQVHDDIGVFFRGMISDGQTEVYSFTSTDRSVSFGSLARGSLWRRRFDYVGIGYAIGWISASHADYLARGGIDAFIGDGALNRATERVFEVFYSVNLLTTIWLSADYQHISNPAYNADRGPVNILGARVHGEF